MPMSFEELAREVKKTLELHALSEKEMYAFAGLVLGGSRNPESSSSPESVGKFSFTPSPAATAIAE